MNHDRKAAMAEATALTRAGRLAEATALIRRTLSGSAPPPDVAPDVVRGEIVIDHPTPRRLRPPTPVPVRACRGPARGAAGGPRGLLPERLGPTVGRGDQAAAASRACLWAPRPARRQPRPSPCRSARARGRDHRTRAPQRGRGPAVPPPRPRGRHRAATAPRDAARRHADGGGLRDGHADPGAGGGARLPRRLPRADDLGELPAVLELVPARRPAPRRGSPRSSSGSSARSPPPTRSTATGCTSRASRRGRRWPPCWAPCTRTCSPRSGCTPGCRTAAPTTSRPPSPRCGAGQRRARSRRPVPVITFHGDADQTVAVDNAARVVEQFSAGALRGDTLVERGPTRPATRVVVRRGGAVSPSSGPCTDRATRGPAARRAAPTPTRAAPTRSAEMVRFFAEHPRRG